MPSVRCFIVLAAVCSFSASAHAQVAYAEPPRELAAEPFYEPARTADDDRPAAVRAALGPAVRFGQDTPRGGFAAVLDVGAGAAGARLSSAWVDVGGSAGLSQYGLELWIDFADGNPIHPVLAAGAALARVQTRAENEDTETHSLGVGTVRGSLEYALPVMGADARAGIDLTGCIPAIRSSEAPRADAWALLVLRVGVGF